MTWEKAVFEAWPKTDQESWAVTYAMEAPWRVDREFAKAIMRLVDWSDLPVSDRDRGIFERWALGATLKKAGAPLSAERSRAIVNRTLMIIRGRVVRWRKRQ